MNTAKYRIIICILIVFIISQQFGCQKTPVTELIPNKLSSEFSEIVSDAPKNPYTYEAPSQWNENIILKNVEIEVNANIDLPNENTYPVYLVTQHNLAGNRLEKIVEIFGGHAIKVRAAGTNREEILEEIAFVARGQYSGIDEETGEPLYEAYEGQDEQLAKLEAELSNLEENTPWKQINEKSFILPMDQVYMSAGGKSTYVSGTENIIKVATYPIGYIQLEKWVLEGEAIPGEAAHELQNISISSVDAQKVATSFIEEIGLDHYIIAESNKARIVLRSYSVLTEGWQITFVRDDGLSDPVDILKYSAGGLLAYPEEEYAASWPAEQITVFVDETGVKQFSWSNAKEISGIANENVQLESFSNIQRSIRNALKFSLSWFNDEKTYENSKLEVLVTRIALTRCIQRMPGDENIAYFAPAWAVFVTTKQSIEDGIEPTILVVSAIDNTYINIRG
ncbi:MAG TPA: DUF6034 family protein [Clostridia bacterium]|nr:DUF6034 family protein [Clostridia bacterium]